MIQFSIPKPSKDLEIPVEHCISNHLNLNKVPVVILAIENGLGFEFNSPGRLEFIYDKDNNLQITWKSRKELLKEVKE